MSLNALLNLQGMMLLLMLLGLFLKKKGIITDAGKLSITDLVIYLVLPCNIVRSFQTEFSHKLLFSCLTVLITAILIQAGCLLLSNLLYKKVPEHQRKVLQYGTVCSNAGFMGNPIAEGIFGSMGLLYASIYLIPQRIVMWSAGISYFTESPDKKTLLKKVVTHPCIIAVFIGFFLMLTQLPLPQLINKTLETASGSCTLLSMLVIGTILADVDIRTMLNRTTVFYAVLRLFLIPGIIYGCCLFASLNPLVTGVSVVLAAMPAGTTTVILASKYSGDAIFAAKCVVLTTILSTLTIPLWCLILL